MLRARALCVNPPAVPGPGVVRDFTLDLAPGEWVALTGPNGCGKTTLALALSGLRPPASGTIEIAGRTLSAATRAGIAMVLQEPSTQLLQPTVAAEIGFTARNLGRREPAVEAMAARWARELGLETDLDRDPRTLSAGRQQLVLIAAALAAEPRVVVMDEAGAHLDPAARDRVLEALRGEADRGLGVVWVTQVPEELEAADRIVTLGAPVRVHVGGEPEAGIAAASARAPGGVRARIDIRPWDGTAGPHVEVGEPLTIEVREAGVVALLGRNGAGKSVVLAAAAGLLALEQVRLSWSGPIRHPPILASQYPEREIFEERVEAEVLYAALSRGLDRKCARVEAARHLETLGLGPEFLGRRSWDLSAGEKRLLQIVGSLIAPADLVLLDEPTCGLDPGRREAMGGLIAARSRRGPVLVAGQDSMWAQAMAATAIRIPGIAPKMASYSKKTD